VTDAMGDAAPAPVDLPGSDRPAVRNTPPPWIVANGDGARIRESTPFWS
jgi:hypothetical protein